MEQKTIIVNATALRYSGALSILKQFLHTIPEDKYHYIVFVYSGITLNFNQNNVTLIPTDVISFTKRFCWDAFGLKRWLRKHNIVPVASISLQNTNFRTGFNIPNYIYYHQPVLFFDHTWSLLKKNEKLLWFYKNIYPFFVKLFINKKTIVFVQLNFIKESFAEKFKFPKNRIFVVYPKLDTPTQIHKNEIAMDKNTVNLFFPAQPLFYKNHNTLFAALEYLNKSFALFLTQVTNKDFPNTPNSINVNMLGRVSDVALSNLYWNSDALVFPSYIETFGLPLTEAASIGLPIIASDLPYAREVLSDYDGVTFVKYNDAEGWANAISEIKKGKRYQPIDVSTRPSWKYFFETIHNTIDI